MRALKSLLIIIFAFLWQANLSYSFQKTLNYSNHTYEPSIKTVQLYPQGRSIETVMAPAVKNLDNGINLVLEFDDIKEDADYYYVRFIHCNVDWTPSDFRSNMVVEGYNEFEIEDFEFSTEAKIGYVHYRYVFPKFKRTGNFIAVVYRNQDKEDLILTRRFMVYQNQAGIGAKFVRSASVNNRLSHQRIEATVNYGNVRANDPKENFTIVVRQNQRWDNAKFNLPPTYIDENAKTLTYRNLGDANDFSGGNEFRFFDLSTVNFSGRNVAEIKFVNNKPVARVMPEKPRPSSYFQNLDINGQFYINDKEANTNAITAEYVDTQLTLQVPEQRSSIYVLGAFNDWKRNELSRLTYDNALQGYKVNLLLKQGWYDYTYWVDDPLDPNQMDKSFFDTQNQYEVFVYFRGMGSRGDELIGYTKVDYNRRR